MLKKIFQRQIPRSNGFIGSKKAIADLTGLLEKQYKEQVAQQSIQYDPAQLKVLAHLQVLLDKLSVVSNGHQKASGYRFLSDQQIKCQSLYIFGDVGRGKSMLMALFYNACPLEKKRRVHFNTFMQEAHGFIHECRKNNISDAISALAKNIRGSALLLCFDEFHVSDIADAMILGRLFSKLFELGVIVVITSNRHPSDLYQGGLQREQFLFFIKELENAAHVIELAAKEDYRLIDQPAQQTNYYYPLDAHTRDIMRQRCDELTQYEMVQPGVLHVLGRKIWLSAVHRDVAFSSFDELCGQNLGAADYLEIARKFNTLVINDIPRLTREKRNEAKRLVTLIDVLYEHKVKLICSAEVPAQELYVEGDGAFEFRRTVSRLIEMQSEAYMQRK
ncbi:MAG: cell division protein ZapE [Methylovulum sp.]|nr:cell division protein ZapE [Methylovulum sp.]